MRAYFEEEFGPDPLLRMANKFATSPRGVLKMAWEESYATEPPEKILDEFLENYGTVGFLEREIPTWLRNFIRKHATDKTGSVLEA